MMHRRTLISGGFALAAVSFAAPRAQAALAPSTLSQAALPAGPIPGLSIAPEFYPTLVRVGAEFEPGSIHVLSSKHFLYLITARRQAIRYGVAVGRAELVWRGRAVVGRKAEWPSWRPTPEMIARNPAAYARHAGGMKGGPGNPLGARAIYLYAGGRDTAIRIHGTTEPNSIGRSVSNGCLRMVNDHVIDLYDRVAEGAPVFVY